MTKIKTTSVREKNEEDEQIFLAPKLSHRDDGDDAYEQDEDEEGGEAEAAAQTRLFTDMMKITKKKGVVQQVVRTSLSTSAKDTSHLMASLGPSASLKKTGHSHTLPLTLEKSVAKKMKRAAGYENVAMEANKWAKVVKLRREADQLHFPLERSNLQLNGSASDPEPLQMKQPLEQEVYALLQGAKLVQNKKETQEEEAVRKALSLQEVKERSRELWRQKEMKRRYEQKARLMNKSKSRKHHRLLRRERLRKQRAELEELHKTDSEAALERLRELEQARIEERMSLRHKTSKWTHLQGLRATRDKAAMAALQENQRMHRELTAKSSMPADGDDDDDSDGEVEQDEGEGVVANPMNPWTKNLPGPTKGKTSSPEDESFTRFKKFWDEVNRRKEIDRKIEEEMEARKEELEEGEDDKKEEEDEEEEEEEEKGGEEDEEDEEVGREDKEEEGQGGEEDKEDGKEEEKEEEKVQEKNKGSKTKAPKNSKQVTRRTKSESTDNRGHDTTTSGKRKRNNTEREVPKSLTEEAVSIDDLLDEAEVKIKNKVHKKLKKLGMKTDEPWKEVKTKKNKKPKKNKLLPTTTATTAVVSEIEEFDFTSTRNEEKTDERQRRAKTLEDFEAIEGETVDKLQEAASILRKDSTTTTSSSTTTQPKQARLEVDPNKFLKVEAKWLGAAVPDSVGEVGEALDDEGTEEKVEDIIREAFADDYLMEEFSLEKAEAIKKDQGKSMSLALPGWGDWTGPSIKMSNTKMKRFRLRVSHAPRKDSRIGHVLYNEKADVHTNLRKAMVNDLPYPFKSVKDFEASVRAPVGRLFVPEAAHRKLTAPPTITKMGTVITPMSEDELLRHEVPVRGRNQEEKRHKKQDSGDSKHNANKRTAIHNSQKAKAWKAKRK